MYTRTPHGLLIYVHSSILNLSPSSCALLCSSLFYALPLSLASQERVTQKTETFWTGGTFFYIACIICCHFIPVFRIPPSCHDHTCFLVFVCVCRCVCIPCPCLCKCVLSHRVYLHIKFEPVIILTAQKSRGTNIIGN